jgi:nicotinic acid mononucleotide adenylyltransferase
MVQTRRTLIRWLRPIRQKRAVVLLGAFDPPTNAHVAILRAAARKLGAPGVLCSTGVRLARPTDTLLDDEVRLGMLDELASSEGFGLCLADQGTYLAVARDLHASGIEATFVVGSDKLPQLADPSFYTDGEAGVAATFREVTLVVVERPGAATPMRNEVEVIDAATVFANPADAAISATEVRRRVRDGLPVDGLVPPAVAARLEGYTAPGPK